MNKYSKELAEMLGSDVAEVLNEWIDNKLQSIAATPKDCSNDWLPYTVTKPNLHVVKKDKEVSRGSIGSWEDLEPVDNIYDQTDSTLTELNKLRAENLALRQQVEFQKGKVDMLVELLNK